MLQIFFISNDILIVGCFEFSEVRNPSDFDNKFLQLNYLTLFFTHPSSQTLINDLIFDICEGGCVLSKDGIY